MEQLRKPYQGVQNIIKFNWHFYFLSFLLLPVLFTASIFLPPKLSILINLLSILIVAGTAISLAVSFYIYDLSELYNLNWLPALHSKANFKIVNINAGFDETSALLHAKYPNAELIVFDFYNPVKHTEVSIKRARKANPPYRHTIVINTKELPLENNCADAVLILLAAHEIREETERINFFKELNRITKHSGKIVVTEHLRNLPNFLAYSIGFFHFYSKSLWQKTFEYADLKISNEMQITPFIKTFILEKHGTSS